MNEKRTPLIAGNWKMNLNHLQAIANVQKLAWSLSDAGHRFDQTEVAVFPPYTDLRSVQTLLVADKIEISLGAQDASPHDSGAYTGDISAAFLEKLDVKYVLIGHSERRHGHQETDNIVTQKALSVIKHNLIPIICVGETASDLESYGPATVALQQLRTTIQSLTKEQEFVIAYEPVWAIGTGQAATAEQAGNVCAQLRKEVETILGEETAAKTRILYGGSVTSTNVATFMRETHIDGVLVGGASLKPEEFSKIAQFKKHIVA
ncbi:MAG TPA: triose-phosphate isomerase [Microbacteriaceae bacterium]|nr:triose-phosphate isomerase [Microbacteriaceae bacterium]